MNGKESTLGLLPSMIIIKPRKWSNRRAALFVVILGFITCAFYVHRSEPWSRAPLVNTFTETPSTCPQTEPLLPRRNSEHWASVGTTLGTESFKSRAVEWLAGAVRIPTESYDRMDPVGIDPRWEVFGPFHDYLRGAFPLIHTSLALTKVNTYGLVYVWQGADVSLKPVLLAAHQDVVPVDPTTVDKWTHPPYSGHFDGKSIWGRGSSDDKGSLIAIMASVEMLLENHFRPNRSIVLAFGFDEEANGRYGASELAKTLLSDFGEDGFAFLLDEGAGIMSDQYGGIVAIPGIAEKGYLDVRVEVTSPGGHSSLPPPHTSIGILASLLVKYEGNPFRPRLVRNSPFYKSVECRGAHAPRIPHTLRKLIQVSGQSDAALHRLEQLLMKDPNLRNLMGTTQAIDLIQGGVKTNALPEGAWAVVNHRIATESSVAMVKARDTELLRKLAAEYNLTYNAFGASVSRQNSPSRGNLTLTDAWDAALEPAPVTPTGEDAGAYQLLSGTIKATYNAHHVDGDKDNLYVSPGIMSGNTDTRHYWKLTKNIFRYNHYGSGNASGLPTGIHTINEHFDADGLLEMIRFFATLILNADESATL